MMKRLLPLMIMLLLLPLLGGCLRPVELTASVAVEELADHKGEVRIEDHKGIVYLAQEVLESESGELSLLRVRIIDDGVTTNHESFNLKREQVASIRYYRNNSWIVGTATAIATLYILYIYNQKNPI